MICCVYTITAVIFKNPLPAAPILFLHIIYSNMPVSYTHLDVYKRQSHAIAQNLSEEDAERLQKTIEQSDEVERYGTGIFLGAGRDKHFGLDVYKRQPKD